MSTVSGVSSSGGVRGVVVEPGTTGRGANDLRRGPLAGWTLRRRLVVSILGLFALVMLGSGIVLSHLLQGALQRELDARVMSSAARVLGPGGPGGHPDRDGDGGADGRRGDGRLLADMLVVVVDGSTVRTNTVTTTDGQSQTLNPQQVQALLQAGLSNRPTTVDLGGSFGPYRLVGVDSSGTRVVTGLPLTPMLAAVHQMRLITAGLTLLGFVLVGLGTAWVVGRALRPLQRVASTATRVSQLPLSSGEVSVTERVPSRDTDPRTEVGQVGAALNGLLEHVDSSLRVRQESETRLRRFVADASHELRTPLSTVRGYTELSLRDPDLSTDLRRSLQRVESESGRMATLVEDLLLLARLDAGRGLDQDTVDLSMLLIETLSDARVAGPEHHWRLDLPEDAVEVVGDRARLTQVLVNLLANARRHTPPGTTVTGSVRPAGDHAVITVEDDGPGIAPELMPTLFERFSRGDSARTRTHGSTGLGLSIVDAVVTAHRGQISVESHPGLTRFELWLPLSAQNG